MSRISLFPTVHWETMISHILWSAKWETTTLVVQWLRIRLPTREPWVQALVQEDSTCHGATKPVCHNYLSLHSRACEPQLLRLRATTTEAHVPRACAPQQEKSPQWEARTLQQRVAPAHHNQRKARAQQRRPNTAKNKINKKLKKKKLYKKKSFLLGRPEIK